MLIRRAVPADASALTALMQSSGAYAGEYRAILDGLAVTPDQLMGEACHLVEDDHGGIIGFYALVPHGDDIELDLMFVADHAQGGGVGALLFRHMLKRAHALGARRVHIVSHPPAEAFYLRMGARRIGTQPPSGRAIWSRPLLEIDV